jgi:hypothetical protein
MMGGARQRIIHCGALVVAFAVAPGTASAQDIVGSWVGEANLPEQGAYPVRLTFVSAKGGISRYPSDPPCGGMLKGDQKGDYFEYEETVTFGGKDERDDGCIPGTMRLTVDGDTMKYEWWGSFNGQDYTSSGELQRQSGRKR